MAEKQLVQMTHDWVAVMSSALTLNRDRVRCALIN
jgi:hypothetical protein